MTHGGLLKPLLSVLSEPWDNLASIESLKGAFNYKNDNDSKKKKVLLISGRADDFIYPEHMDKLYERFQRLPFVSVQMALIPKGRHVAMYDEPGYYDNFTNYFNSPSD